MRSRQSRVLALTLALCLLLGLSGPALAAGSAPLQQPDPWAYEYFADAFALGLVDDDYGQYIKSVITRPQLEAMEQVVAGKLALLGLKHRTAKERPLVLDRTRGGVLNALYRLCADYALPGVEKGPIFFFLELGVLRGVPGGDLALMYPCTCQEAMIFAVRLILAVYDRYDAGSRGLLWRTVSGDTTLYLLGTVHADRDDVYPLHKSLRGAVAEAQAVYLEVDLNDQAGQARFAAMQRYADGSTLADHIDRALYARTVAVFAALGVGEAQAAACKPWALATTLSGLLTRDDSTGSALMSIDSYVNAAAVNGGKVVRGVETYALQGEIFDSLSPAYQEEYLDLYVSMTQARLAGKDMAEAEEQTQMLDDMMAAWKAGDAAAFEAAYGKAEVLEGEDELSARLFTDRDPNMLAAAVKLLETGGAHTYLLAVGAGHMADPGGIISGLWELGYTVEPVK